MLEEVDDVENADPAFSNTSSMNDELGFEEDGGGGKLDSSVSTVAPASTTVLLKMMNSVKILRLAWAVLNILVLLVDSNSEYAESVQVLFISLAVLIFNMYDALTDYEAGYFLVSCNFAMFILALWVAHKNFGYGEAMERVMQSIVYEYLVGVASAILSILNIANRPYGVTSTLEIDTGVIILFVVQLVFSYILPLRISGEWERMCILCYVMLWAVDALRYSLIFEYGGRIYESGSVGVNRRRADYFSSYISLFSTLVTVLKSPIWLLVVYWVVIVSLRVFQLFKTPGLAEFRSDIMRGFASDHAVVKKSNRVQFHHLDAKKTEPVQVVVVKSEPLVAVEKRPLVLQGGTVRQAEVTPPPKKAVVKKSMGGMVKSKKTPVVVAKKKNAPAATDDMMYDFDMMMPPVVAVQKKAPPPPPPPVAVVKTTVSGGEAADGGAGEGEGGGKRLRMLPPGASKHYR